MLDLVWPLRPRIKISLRYNVDKAFKRLQSHAQWRIEYVPNGRIEEVHWITASLTHLTLTTLNVAGGKNAMHLQEDITPELDAKKSFLQGLDKKGRPLSICMPSRHSKSARNLDKTKKLIAYALDNCIHAIDISRNPTGKTVAIFDLRGMPTP